jgi:hypothetical protein
MYDVLISIPVWALGTDPLPFSKTGQHWSCKCNNLSPVTVAAHKSSSTHDLNILQHSETSTDTQFSNIINTALLCLSTVKVTNVQGVFHTSLKLYYMRKYFLLLLNKIRNGSCYLESAWLTLYKLWDTVYKYKTDITNSAQLFVQVAICKI